MIWLLLLLLVSLLLAAAVAGYVGYVRRGRQVPHLPWLGGLMQRGIRALPTVDNLASRPSGDEESAAGGTVGSLPPPR